MDTKEAIAAYQFGDRAKSELLILSSLLTFTADLPKEEKAGGKRVLLTFMQLVRTETAFGLHATGLQEFQRVVDRLSEAIGMVESDAYVEAGQKVGAAVSAATTAAQKGWQVLAEHGLL